MFEHLPYNPNISMVSAASVSSKDQAAVIDRICCVVGGHGVFSTGGFVKIGEISPSVFFEDAFSFHKAESASAFEEDNPEGTWAVLVYFRPIVSDEMKNRVEGMFLSGLIPDAVRKVACFQIQGRSFNWIGGQRALSRTGIPILEDTSEAFTVYRWDPIMELQGRPMIHMPELGVEVPEEFRPVIVERPPKPKVERRYWILNRGFLSGKFKGQLDSVYKTRVENPGKVDEFRKAIAYGDVKFIERLTQVQMKKCEELGIIVPDEYRYVPPVKKSVAQKVPNLAEI